MNGKSKLRILGINFLLFAILFGLVSFNKEHLRPAFAHLPVLKMISGCFPNFIAAYIISLASVNAVLMRKPKHGRIYVYISSFVVFGVLTIEEISPMWGASEHYDSFDILASAIGALFAILSYELIAKMQVKKKNKIEND